MNVSTITRPLIRHCFILLLALCPLALCATAGQSVLDDTLLDYLDRAMTLNDEHRYLEAYRTIVTTDRAMMLALERRGTTTLNDNDFELFYWPIKKTRAEVAYKLALHDEMAKISGEMDEALTDHPGLEQAWLDAMNGDLAKIDGSRYLLTHALADAESELHKALILKPYDPQFIAAVRDDLAQVYYVGGHYWKALAQLDTLLASVSFDTAYRFRSSDNERLEIESQRALCMARLGLFDEALALIGPIVKHYKKKDQRRYAEALRKQGKIMMLQRDATGRLNPKAQKCYRDYLEVMRAYVDSHFINMSDEEREQFWMAEQPFVTDCYGLENAATDMLYDVALFSKAVLLQMGRSFTPSMTRAQRQRILADIRIKWRDVQAALPDSAAAIEFVTYQKESQEHLGALVVTRKASRPVFIPIAAVNSILDHRLSTGSTVHEVISLLLDDEDNNALYTDSTLINIIWNEAMVKAIGPCTTVYFAPDGILHTMAIEYMLPEALNQASFNRLTTTRLLTQPRRALNTSDMLLCGYVDYENCCNNAMTADNDAVAYGIIAAQFIHWPPLPGTLIEVDSIKVMRGNRAEDRMLLRDSVSEPLVRQLMQRYHIVHLATHGISPTLVAAGNDLQPVTSDTQLSRSCLILSGAETYLQQPDFDASQPDGILSARELAGMDLSRVDLAVLSACLSGRGAVSTDGVYGLQRGLKAAGVRSLIVSLWEVDDNATYLLMKSFYSNLEQGMSLRQAFEKARETLRTHETKRQRRWRRLSRGTYSKPHFCDAFILIDGI